MHRQDLSQPRFVTGEGKLGKKHEIGALACSQVDDINVSGDVFLIFPGYREDLRSD
ncbi:hypothetical protein D3C76_1371030 [compost metagenome]